MFKINSYSLLFLGLLFVSSSNVHAFSSNSLNNNSAQSQQSLFPDIYQCPESSVSTIIRSATPQSYQWNFNSSTNTFIPPIMLSEWRHNMSTDTLNINSFSLPIPHEIRDCNDAFANTNNSNPFFIPLKSIPSNTKDTSANTNSNSTTPVVPHTQQQKVVHANKDKDHVLPEKKKKKKECEKIYTCPTCNKQIASNSSFKYHLSTHDPNRKRSYQCHLCKKSFFSKNILKIHIKRHNKEKLFKCDFCSKPFTTRHEKIKHHRTHTGEKPYKCNICGKGLSSKEVLKDHLNIHRRKKPYKCAQCTKAYVTKGGLNQHIKKHNRSKFYACHYCDATFTHKSEYESHIGYEEEKDEDRKCHICKKLYSNKYNLREHNKRYHSGM